MWLIVAPLMGFTVQMLVKSPKKQSRQLQDMARTDNLTGLPNRRAWEKDSLANWLAPNVREFLSV